MISDKMVKNVAIICSRASMTIGLTFVCIIIRMYTRRPYACTQVSMCMLEYINVRKSAADVLTENSDYFILRIKNAL